MTYPAASFPRRFRRRLRLSFIAVASLATGAVAVMSFGLAREYRLDGFEERARREAQLNLRLSRSANPTFLSQLVDSYRQQEGFDVVAVSGELTLSTHPALNIASVPDEVVERVSESPPEDVTAATATRTSVRYLVVGGRAERSNVELYFFFSLEEVLDSLSEFRTALISGWAAVAVIAALVGELVARRTLRPVRNAADAARALAEGLLDTRLPVGTSDEFGAWASYFNEMADALAQKIRALSEATERERRFTADVAHELRTPLATLANATSILRNDVPTLPPASRRPAELVIDGVDRLRLLVEDLLELARLDSGEEPLHLEDLALDDAVRAVLHAAGWHDRVTLLAEPTPVLADRRRIERVATNLVSNSVIHGDGRVRVRVFPQGEHAVLEVSDDGPGIPEADVPRLFDRFYKAREARSGPGSGLGLAIVAENVELLGGQISVVSTPGLGSTFTVRLPARTLDATAGGGRAAEVTAP